MKLDSRIFACVILFAVAATNATSQVRYKGSTYSPDALPESAPQALRDLGTLYAPIVKKLKLRAYFASSDDFALFYSGGIRSASSLHKRADKVTQLFTKAWGSTQEREPYAVFVFRKQKAIGTFLDLLVPKYPYLEEWSKSARNAPGFNLYKPPLYVILDQTAPKNEFRLPNTVIHQQTHLLLYREFHALPFWLKEGLAWYAEEALTRKIYHFNHRNGFVSKKEHTGWRPAAKTIAKTNSDFARVLASDSTEFDREIALLAHGFARFLLKLDGEKARVLLTQLGEAQWKKSDEGKNPNVELSAEEQEKILAAVLGEDYEEQVIRFISK